MTDVKFYKKGGQIYKIVCHGHTDYGAKGEDIVCAALSSIVQTAVLGVMQVAGVNGDLKRNDAQGYLEFSLPEKMSERQANDTRVILDTLLLGVSDLYEGYSDFIGLDIKEER